MAQTNLVDVRNIVRSFVIDEEECTLILNHALYEFEKRWFLEATYEVLSNQDLYGAQHFDVLGDFYSVRAKLHNMDYIEWNEAAHSYLLHGYRIDVDDVVSKALHYARNHGIETPVTVCVREMSVVFEYDDMAKPQIIDNATAQAYWDETCA